MIERRIGDRARGVDPYPHGAALTRACHGEDFAGPGAARRLPAGRHPGGLHRRVRVRASCRRGLLQQDRGDQVIRRPLGASPVQAQVIGPLAGQDRGGGHRRHEQHHQDQPQGRLDPVRSPAQRVAVEAEPPGRPGHAPCLVCGLHGCASRSPPAGHPGPVSRVPRPGRTRQGRWPCLGLSLGRWSLGRWSLGRWSWAARRPGTGRRPGWDAGTFCPGAEGRERPALLTGGVREEDVMTGMTYGIVAGYDGSPGAAQALRWAAGKPRRAARHSPSAWPGRLIRWGCPPGRTCATWPGSTANRSWPRGCRTPSRYWAPAGWRGLAGGSAAHVLCEHSRAAEMVVLGSRGYSELRDLPLGSVSWQVAGHARGRVVVVRGEWRPANQPAGPVVVGADGSPAAPGAMTSRSRRPRCATCSWWRSAP